MSFCPRCGAKVQAGDRYCQECSSELARAAAPRTADAAERDRGAVAAARVAFQPASPAALASPRCTNCGTDNKAVAKFCRQCGQPLVPPSEDEERTLVAAPPPQAPARREETTIIEAAAARPDKWNVGGVILTQARSESQQPKRAEPAPAANDAMPVHRPYKGGLSWGLALAAVAALAGGLYFAWSAVTDEAPGEPPVQAARPAQAVARHAAEPVPVPQAASVPAPQPPGTPAAQSAPAMPSEEIAPSAAVQTPRPEPATAVRPAAPPTPAEETPPRAAAPPVVAREASPSPAAPPVPVKEPPAAAAIVASPATTSRPERAAPPDARLEAERQRAAAAKVEREKTAAAEKAEREIAAAREKAERQRTAVLAETARREAAERRRAEAERPRATETARREAPEPVARAPAKQEGSHWSRMRQETRACGEGFGGLVCRERVRWKYCDGHWGKVDECPMN